MIRLIVFDFCGTLINDVERGYGAAMSMFDQFRIPHITLQEYRQEFEQPYMKFYNKYMPDLTIEEQKKLYNAYVEQHEAELFPSVSPTLRWCAEHDRKLAVLSVFDKLDLDKELERLGIIDLFCRIEACGHDKRQRLAPLIRQCAVSPGETLMVGDSEHDVETARNAGAKAAVLTWGYRPRKILEAAKPDFVWDDIAEIKTALDRVCP